MSQEERVYIKDLAIQFLRELQDDRREFIQNVEVEISALKRKCLRTADTKYITLNELDQIFGDLRDNIILPFIDRSSMNVAVKGVRRIRTLLSYGEDGQVLFLDEEEEKSEKITEKERRKITEEKRQKLEEVIDDLTTKRVKRVQSGLLPILKKLSFSLKKLSSSIDDKFVQIEQKTADLRERRKITEVKNLSDKLGLWGTTLDALLIQVGNLGTVLQQELQFEEKDPLIKSQEEISSQLSTVEQHLQEMADTIKSSVQFIEETDVDSLTKSKTINAGRTIEETLGKALSELATIDGELTESIQSDQEIFEKALSELGIIDGVPTKPTQKDQESFGMALSELGSIDGEVTGEIEGEDEEVTDLKRKIAVLQTELRRQNILLEHTRKTLSSNPKYAALFILEELSNMPISSLAKSVGTSAIALRSLLGEFIEKGLLIIDGDNSNALVRLAFGTAPNEFRKI